jgi:hypothetical protein
MSRKTSLFQRIVAVGLLVTLASVAAFATATLLTTQVLLINGSANAPITAGSLTVTLSACDAVNGNSFTSTGREILLVDNTGGSTYTWTATSVADPFNRLDTSLTNYSIAAGVIDAVQMKNLTGWQQSGLIQLTCSNAAVKFAVLQTN